MRLGIDLGTTRTVAAVSDRGNYPVVGFVTPDGDGVDYFPSVVAERDGSLRYGHEAVRAARQGAPCLRSFKRLLSLHGPEHVVRIGTVEISLLDLTTSFLGTLATALRQASNVPRRARQPWDTFISVPANAHSNQRFTTLEAFRRAGFSVRAMMNEPSAAGIEFAHRFEHNLNRRREHVAIYDLGGGTFDAALVRLTDGRHEVVDTAGIQQLGGDDFDAALLDMVTGEAGIDAALPEGARDALLAQCREAKEALTPQTRRMHLDVHDDHGGASVGTVAIDVNDFYARLAPLIGRTIRTLARVLPRAGSDDGTGPGTGDMTAGLAGVYVVGGASSLPAIGRQLREQFGRRVHRSAYPSAATAIGLAIAAGAVGHSNVVERFTRNFGVFRESEHGHQVVFDNIIAAGTPLPEPSEPPLTVSRRYRAAHNVGHFRFVECARLGCRGEPSGDVHPYAELRVPFIIDANGGEPQLTAIERLPRLGPLIEERYEVTTGGVVSVAIHNIDTGRVEQHTLR